MVKKERVMPLGYKIVVCCKCEYLDPMYSIYDEVFSKKKYVVIFGKPFKIYDREFINKNKILERDGKPVGFKE